MENFERCEQIGKNRERLLSLEKEGKYVFHGSPETIQSLEPRQAYNRNEKTGEMEKDGEPAVFATPYADVAIFRALINTKDVSGESTSQFGINEEQLHFSTSRKLLDEAINKIGKVFVLDKQKFGNFEGMQCKSGETVIPIEVIEVTVNDLPKDIKILE